MPVAQLIKTKRTRLGLTQKHFAELAGLGEVGERTVRGWENDEHAPTPNALERIMGIPESAPYKNHNKNPVFRFIDLFAGIGGVRLPFHVRMGQILQKNLRCEFRRSAVRGHYKDHRLRNSGS